MYLGTDSTETVYNSAWELCNNNAILSTTNNATNAQLRSLTDVKVTGVNYYVAKVNVESSFFFSNGDLAQAIFLNVLQITIKL